MDVRGVVMGALLIGTMIVYLVPVIWAISKID